MKSFRFILTVVFDVALRRGLRAVRPQESFKKLKTLAGSWVSTHMGNTLMHEMEADG
ncbi:MAG TPA: hypothetical protein VNO32_45575 [Candidatus Acidoferrum sp.]|nr:hypothetical protein [Candidatus Acidoferrum sp.]